MTWSRLKLAMVGRIFFKCIIAGMLFLSCNVMSGQDYTRQFGDINISCLMWGNDSLYPESEAAILFDYGIANTTSISRHVQIKIYKKEGFKWASLILQGWGEFQKRDILKKIEAACYSLEGKEVVTNKLDEDDISKISNTNDIEVCLSSVKEGSIVEFKYELEVRKYEWQFQYTIPVYWSEFLIINPKNYIYQITHKGHVPFDIYDVNYNGYTRYVTKSVPPFILEEPVTSIDNHLTKIEYYPSQFITLTNDTLNFALTWYDICQDLLSSEKFGKSLEGNLYLNDLKNEILSKDTLDLDMMISAHEKIKKSMKWNGRNSVLVDFTLRSALKEGTGNSADINLNLVALLRKLGFDADPVVMATSNRGFLAHARPEISNLNYVIAAVTLNRKLYLMDATNLYLTIDMLPLQALNDKGMIIDGDKAYWIDFENQLPYKYFRMYTLEMDSLGNLKGDIQTSREWYAAYEFRNEYADITDQSIPFESYMENQNDGMKVLSYELFNFNDLYKPLQEVCRVEIKNIAEFNNDQVGFFPMFYERITDNPFKLKSRLYPVEYPFLQDKLYTLNIAIPENFKIEYVPDDMFVTLPKEAAKFEFRTIVSGNKIQLTSQIKINKCIFLPAEYNDLKEYYEMIIGKHAEQIILKRKGL